MEALILEYENKEALTEALTLLTRSEVMGIVATTLSPQELQLIGKQKLIRLKEEIELRSQTDEDEVSEEEIKAIIDEVRQKRYAELHNRH